MAGESGVQNYLNTLIFALVAKTVTLIILVALFFKVMQPFMYFFLTLEVGLIVIVTVAMVAIVRYDKRMNAERKKITESVVSLSACPDFYEQIIVPSGPDAGSTVCSNQFQTSDGKFTYKYIYGDPVQQEQLDSINIDQLVVKKKLTEACGTVDNETYKHMPWTDMRSKCSVMA